VTLPAEVVSSLTARGWTLAVAESLTGGSLAASVVSVPGASATLLGAVVAYATEVKHSLLGVDAQLLAAHGPVHPEVARQMASGVRRAVSLGAVYADVGVATTGIAGPDSPDGQPVGTVHIAVETPRDVVTRAFVFAGDRASIRSQSVDAALAMLLESARE
jgi:nicotinamide-nucleotide amidase